MENKRLTRKLNSFFWWFLMALPLILIVITYVCSIPQYAKNFDWSNYGWYDFIDYSVNDSQIFVNFVNTFDNMSITNIFTRVFLELSIDNYEFVAYLLNWCLTIYFVHLLFDCVSFIFSWLHDFFERG